ncbi:F0F1 ATP synthase subunit delta [Prevotella sp. PINT]|jgi:ATP synthase, F1 delta subunit|uniref:F0F1 ATP synthase subunit delta n=1 Tax=Palleniella intestinalis TaxID=2736291 RepID=UPI0015525110|nr:F0F1 ATP synthase subunit delta [Palleniella intestinalis]NPD81564.1 F0F1 ATP synthase subunit delta [Palleniella intestinalis]
MDLGVISIRYARALHKSAVQTGCDEDVYNDMVTLASAYMDVPQLRHTIDNPMLPQEKKESLLKAACGAKPAELTMRFLKLVLQEGRETVMQLIAQSYITLYRKQKNIIHGRLITATAVSPETENKVRQMVEHRTNGTVEFLTEINPDIIGGFILEYDTYRMDASVKSRLQSILKQLK